MALCEARVCSSQLSDRLAVTGEHLVQRQEDAIHQTAQQKTRPRIDASLIALGGRSRFAFKTLLPERSNSCNKSMGTSTLSFEAAGFSFESRHVYQVSLETVTKRGKSGCESAG